MHKSQRQTMSRLHTADSARVWLAPARLVEVKAAVIHGIAGISHTFTA